MIVTNSEADWLLERIDMEQCSAWEREFVNSLRMHRGNNRTLTVRQIETLTRVWDRQS